VEAGVVMNLRNDLLNRAVEPSNTVPGASSDTADEDIIPGVESPLVLDVPPKQVVHLRGKLKRIQPGLHQLALSDMEWASLHLEDEDE
jgi:hypothetical protein